MAFGTAHGWKESPFDLTMTCPENETAAIYYTLDGTSPKVGGESTFRYDGPIRVDRTTVVRAAVPDADSILQVDRSATYLFYDDVIAQGDEPPPGFPENEQVNHQRMLYGMSEAVTAGDDETKARLKRGLTENCRTVSLVIDPRNLFDGVSGIFVNASGNGRDWERQTMVEQINPMDPGDEFSVPAGLRIRGGLSRSSDHPKHSFRLFFRSEYGMGTLEHPLFGDEGADEFEKVDLRTSQNYGWANDSGGDTFINELWSRDSERAMGKTYNRSRYYHLFINGIYWGLYMTEERVDQNYAKDYNGGVAENYDVVRTSQPGYSTGVAEGETGAWTELWRLTTQEGYGAGHEANYNRVRGFNPDGTRNPDYPVLLNETNLIEHILTVHFAQDGDAPVNSGGWANNVIGFRNRRDGEARLDGFLWNRHDAEHSLGRAGGADSFGAIRYGTPEQTDTDRDLMALGNFNPNLLHWELMANAEYRQVFADLVYRHMVKAGGALTAAEGEKRYRARMAEIDDAIVAESARWGYQYGRTDRDYDGWLKNCESGIRFINRRLEYLIPEYQRRQWYPSVRPATFVDGRGAEIPEGATIDGNERVYLSNPDGGKAYYTMDGGDPRVAGGAVAAGATEYAEGLAIPATGATIAVRVLRDGEWSPLETVGVKGGAEPSESPVERNLRFYEIEGIPAAGNDGAGEYLVLMNLSESAELDLTGVRIFIGKKDDMTDPGKSGDGEAKCKLTLADGTVAAGSTVRFSQPDYAKDGWAKITDGDLILKIYDAGGALVQCSEVRQKGFTDYARGLKALRATSFGRETGTGDWTEVDLPQSAKTVEPGLVIEVTAADAEAAKGQVALKVTVPTADGVPVVDDETYRGYFVLAANPVADRPGVYAVGALLNEAIVRPVIAVADGIETPFAVVETGGVVTIRTLPGLYYSLVRGWEADKIDSIRACRLATGTTIRLSDTGKPPKTAFYRAKVSFDEQEVAAP